MINPEATFDHIPQVLREQQALSWVEGREGCTVMARKIREHVATLVSPLGSAEIDHTPFYGMSRVDAAVFIGRIREMWDLHGHLTAKRIAITSGRFGQSVAQIRGLGGNGKSLLAREYAVRFGESYPGGVFWLNAYGDDAAAGSFAIDSREAVRKAQIHRFAQLIGIDTDDLNPEQAEREFWQKLRKTGTPCLWLVDDLPSALTQAEIENHWISGWEGASTLITTRSREYRTEGGIVDLEGLPAEEAEELLMKDYPPAGETEREAAKQIARELGYHPLAIEVARSYLAVASQGYEKYLTDLRSPEFDAAEFGAGLSERLALDHERSISATLLKSIRLLSGPALDYLRMASVLPAEPIPQTLTEGAFEQDGLRGWMRFFRRARRDDTVRVVHAISQIQSLGLCTTQVDGARSVHTLVSRTVRFREGSSRRTRRLRRALTEALAKSLQVTADIARHQDIAHEMVHARYLLASGVTNTEEADLAERVGEYDSIAANHKSAQKLFEAAFECHRKRLGKEHRKTIRALRELAWVFHQQGNYAEALKLGKTAAEASQRRLGAGDPDTWAAFNSLALTLLHGFGNMAEAQRLFAQIVWTSTKVLGDEHRTTLAALDNLALTLQKQGELDAARRIYEQVLAASRRQLGEDHPDTLKSLGNIADILEAQGDLNGARKRREEVLVARRRVFGEQHPETLTAMLEFGDVLREKGDLPEARKVHEDAMRGLEQRLGAEHPYTLTARQHLAMTVLAQDDPAQAWSLEQTVVKGFESRLGREHPTTLGAIAVAALILNAKGDLAEARKLMEQVLKVKQRHLGKEHPDTLMATAGVAELLRREGDSKGARKLYEQSVELARRHLGEEDSRTLELKQGLSTVLFKEGDLASARSIEKEILAISRRDRGPEHPDTLSAIGKLAETREAQGDLAGARELREEFWKISLRLRGLDNPQTLGGLFRLASTIRAEHDPASARQLYAELESIRSVRGDDHPATLPAIQGLGLTLHDAGDLVEARRVGEHLLEASRRILGPWHPTTTDAAWNLTRTLLFSGEPDLAKSVIANDLLWLLQEAPDPLAESQREIRASLATLFDRSENSPTAN